MRVGDRFGCWHLAAMAEPRLYKGAYRKYYKVKCNCGNQFEISRANVVRRKTPPTDCKKCKAPAKRYGSSKVHWSGVTCTRSMYSVNVTDNKEAVDCQNCLNLMRIQRNAVAKVR